MFETYNDPEWQDDICDFCGQRRIHDVAEEIVEPGVMEDGKWTGHKWTKEKSEKWKLALKKAYEQLTKPCLVINTTEWDQGTVCRDCLERFLKKCPTG